MIISLRAIQPEDREMIRNWRNSPDVSVYMNTDRYITQEEHEQRFNTIRTEQSSRYWILCHLGVDAGLIGFTNIDLTESSCDALVYIADPKLRGKRSGVMAILLLLEQVFEVSKLDKMYFEHLDFNEPIAKLKRFLKPEHINMSSRTILKQGVEVQLMKNVVTREDWKYIQSLSLPYWKKLKKERQSE